jgi:hypothetical protein
MSSSKNDDDSIGVVGRFKNIISDLLSYSNSNNFSNEIKNQFENTIERAISCSKITNIEKNITDVSKGYIAGIVAHLTPKFGYDNYIKKLEEFELNFYGKKSKKTIQTTKVGIVLFRHRKLNIYEKLINEKLLSFRAVYDLICKHEEKWIKHGFTNYVKSIMLKTGPTCDTINTAFQLCMNDGK